MSFRHGPEHRHVRRSVERRRQNALRGGRSRLSQEPLELNRLEADQEPRSLGLRDEGVGHALGTERKRPWRQARASVGDVDRDLAIKNKEPLVLVVVDV